jgi:hypothetical protein
MTLTLTCERVVRESVREDFVGVVSNELSAEAKESPLLEAVTRERLVKTSRLKRYSMWWSNLWRVEISGSVIVTCSYDRK